MHGIHECCFVFKGLEGENCLRSSDCVEGLCCARHFWSKICKPVLKEGQVCTKNKRKGTHGLEIFQRCDCAEGLSCKTQRDGSKSSRSLHTCQRHWMNIRGIFFHTAPREAKNRLDQRRRRAIEGKQEWDTLFFLHFLVSALQSRLNCSSTELKSCSKLLYYTVNNIRQLALNSDIFVNPERCISLLLVYLKCVYIWFL